MATKAGSEGVKGLGVCSTSATAMQSDLARPSFRTIRGHDSHHTDKNLNCVHSHTPVDVAIEQVLGFNDYQGALEFATVEHEYLAPTACACLRARRNGAACSVYERNVLVYGYMKQLKIAAHWCWVIRGS